MLHNFFRSKILTLKGSVGGGGGGGGEEKLLAIFPLM